MAQQYNQQYQRAIVAGGLASCALAVRLELQGIANDNQPGRRSRFAPRQPEAQDAEWPVGLSNHVTVTLDVSHGKTCVRVAYPAAS